MIDPSRVASRHASEGQFKTAAARVAAKYQNKKQVDKADGSGKTTVYEYSKGQVDHRNREKAKRIEGLKGNISKLRSKVKSDLTNDDPKTRLTALAISLMDETCERVGNDESAEERGHFGVTTLQAKHVKINGGKATLTYTGKSGVKHSKTVENSGTVSALKKALKGKSGDDTILCEGDDCIVRANDVNDYLKEYDITAKDIRGYRANDEMVKQLKEQRSKGKELPNDRKEKDEILKAEFKKALEATAEVVGHESSTLRSQYLVPKLEDSYVHDGTVMDKWDKKASDAAMLNHYEMTLEGLDILKTISDAYGSKKLTAYDDMYISARQAWKVAYANGKMWLAHVIDKKAIPPRKHKAVEMLARLFSKKYSWKGPKQGPLKWYKDNERRWALLPETKRWDDRSEEGGGIWSVGPFKVHDTVGAKPEERERINEIIEKAVKSAGRTGLPGFKSVLYGDVYIVGKIGRPNWAAWYMPAKDAIYMRVSGKKISQMDASQTLLHELTHRYKAKFMSRDLWATWRQYHYDLSQKPVEPELPGEGEVLPFKVNRKEVVYLGPDTVGNQMLATKADPDNVYLKVERLKYYGWFKKMAGRGKFPSAYAATDAEEHLCEAASYRALRRLKKPHLDFFGQIMKGEYETHSAIRVASRWADLNPQLGWPGGPCHVVERIHDEVRNPRLRDHLTEKVEDGEKLTNPEANKVYDMERERGTRVKFLSKLHITPHAQYRMDQRGITVNDLRVALMSFAKAFYDSKSKNGYEYQSWSEDMAYGKEIRWVDEKNGGLAVVFQADGRGGVVIITTYWEGLSDPRPVGTCDARVAARHLKLIMGGDRLDPPTVTQLSTQSHRRSKMGDGKKLEATWFQGLDGKGRPKNPNHKDQWMHQGPVPGAKEQWSEMQHMLAVLKDGIGATGGEEDYPKFLNQAFERWQRKVAKLVGKHFGSRETEPDTDDSYLWETRLTKDGVVTHQKWFGHVYGGTWPRGLRMSDGQLSLDEDLYISPVGRGIEEDVESVTTERDDSGGKRVAPNDRRLQGLPTDGGIALYFKPSKPVLLAGWKEIEQQHEKSELRKLIEALGLKI